MIMELARPGDSGEILGLYREVIDKVNRSSVKLGWNTEIYPDRSFVEDSIRNGEMCIMRDGVRIIAAAVVNHNVNPEYDDIDWEIKEPSDRIATIHALAVLPEMQGSKVSYLLLSEIEDYCRARGDIAIHLDVIDTNIPAYKLYIRNGYREVSCIRMFYEVVGTRQFWMMEHVL